MFAFHLIGALILAYALSRATLRLPLVAARWPALLAAHALALAIGVVPVAAIRLGAGVSPLRSVLFLAVAQGVWVSVDGMRRNFPPLRAAGF